MSDCTFVSSRFWFSSEVVCFGDRLQQSCFTSARAQDAELRPRLAQEKDRVLRALFFTPCANFAVFCGFVHPRNRLECVLPLGSKSPCVNFSSFLHFRAPIGWSVLPLGLKSRCVNSAVFFVFSAGQTADPVEDAKQAVPPRVFARFACWAIWHSEAPLLGRNLPQQRFVHRCAEFVQAQ